MKVVFKRPNPNKLRMFAISGKTIGFLFSILIHILIIFLLASTRFPIRQKLIQQGFREIRLISSENSIVNRKHNISPELRNSPSEKRISDYPKMTQHPDFGSRTGMAIAPISKLDLSLITTRNISLSNKYLEPESAFHSGSRFLNVYKPNHPQEMWKSGFTNQLTFIPAVSIDMADMLYEMANSSIPVRVSLDSEQVDLTAWSEKILDKIHQQWIIPAASKSGHKDRVKIRTRIKGDGSIVSIEIINPSPEKAYNQAATEAISACIPFPPLPVNISQDWIDVFFLFTYYD